MFVISFDIIFSINIKVSKINTILCLLENQVGPLSTNHNNLKRCNLKYQMKQTPLSYTKEASRQVKQREKNRQIRKYITLICLPKSESTN